MASDDVRIPRWDLRASAGSSVALPFTSDTEVSDLSIWVGGTVDPDVDDLTDATEHPATIAVDGLSGSFVIAVPEASVRSTPLRVTLGGVLQSVGELRPSTTGKVGQPDAITLTVGDGQVLELVVATPGPQGLQGETGPAGPTGAKGDAGDPGAGVPAGGATGQALVKGSATDYDTAWADLAVAGSGLPSNIVNATTTATAAVGDFVLADATATGFTVTLPASPTTGDLVAVKKIDPSVNVVTVSGGAKTIDGDATAEIISEDAGAVFSYDGSNWQVVGVTSAQGPQGPEGPQGATGPQGPQGEPGATGGGVPYASERAVVGAVTDLVVPGIPLRDLAVGVSVGANLIVYMPAFVQIDRTLLSLNVEVTTSVAASSIRLALYRATSNFQPGELVVQSGAISSATIGKKSYTTSTALTAGTYIAAVSSDAAVQVRGWQGVSIPNQPLNGSTFGGGGNIMRGLWRKSAAFGAFTDPGTAWDTSTDTGATMAGVTYPLIAFGF